jgi:hypothetical protein
MLIIVTHEHRHGLDTFLLDSPNDLHRHQILRACDLDDFDPHNETLDWDIRKPIKVDERGFKCP